MNKLYEQAKALREAASKLEVEADALELPALMEKYKYVVGSCWKLKEKSGDDSWDEYIYVKSLNDINIRTGGVSETVGVLVFKFTMNHPYYERLFTGNDYSYLHNLETYAKKISRDEFNKAFVKFQESITI